MEQIRDYSDIPVLYLSEEKDIFSLVKAFDRGANDYILVPFNEKIFVARLKSLIRREQWDVQTKENRKSCSEREK